MDTCMMSITATGTDEASEPPSPVPDKTTAPKTAQMAENERF
jgi:hypothetical protein